MSVVSAFRRPKPFVAAVTVFTSLTLLSTSIAPASSLLRQLSTDPYTNSTSQHKTEAEPDNFAYGNTIISATQVGRFFDGGSSNIGWSTSTDSGATWVNGFLPGITTYQGGQYDRASDPAVAYDAAHNTWMISELPLYNSAGIGAALLVSRSTDGGLTWQNPVTAVDENGLDKSWIACDNSTQSPYYGRCYVEWDNNYNGNLMQMSTSTDGGITWGPPMAPADSASGLGGQPVVQPNGTVVVPISANDSGILSFVSQNGGASWSSSVYVADSITHDVNGNIRTSPLPSAEIDGAGKVYVVWQDCRFRSGCSSNDIVMSTSTDGLTWSAVTRIPIDPLTSTVDHFIPGIGVDKATSGANTHIALTYYYYPVSNCSGDACKLSVGYIASNNGGETWGPSVQLATGMKTSWLANTNQGRMAGDYISTAFTADGKAHPVFSFAHAPTGTLFDQAMYTTAISLVVPPSGSQITGKYDQPVPNAKSDYPKSQKPVTRN